LLCGIALGGHATARAARHVVNLDGTWEIAEGKMDARPKAFDHKAPVPGLADMAEPAFEQVGFAGNLREAFWYRRTFRVDGPVPDVALLKLHKARYGVRVWLNGQLIGEHLPCFTPALLDVRSHLKGDGAENELVVRVGAFRDSVPKNVPSGWDFEKYRYIPGIYDSVELILCGTSHVVNVQTAPNVESRRVRVVVELDHVDAAKADVRYALREAKSGKVVAEGNAAGDAGGAAKLDFTVAVPDCRFWSPEDPFLYELELRTAGDDCRTRFGMRSFRFDPATGRAVLNGKPYFLRGTNVCILRFFEDAARGNLPWRKDWVRRLHQKFKGMHWNSIRYCIGFPPELWYDIADEEGLLIQDEFPVWTLSDKEQCDSLDADQLAREYTEWMRERWNHPCVVIWDAQNESNTPKTGKALMTVRHQDLSNRPWDNGWAEPQSVEDCVEAHPYLMIGLFNPGWGNAKFRDLKDMAHVSGVPSLNEAQRKLKAPILINEYAWLWLNRDGTTTCLTGPVYEKLLGLKSTTQQRRELYAKYLAAKTEFWRARRKCAGVLHFCGLGYSRAGDKPRPVGGATSDHFIDLENLTFEPLFEKYVRDAFAPVGLMIDQWDDKLPPGADKEIPVVVINDLDKDVPFTVTLRLVQGDKTLGEQSQKGSIAALGQQNIAFKTTIPKECGKYELVAELRREGAEPVSSRREFEVAGRPNFVIMFTDDKY
jgi:hypothetical protein